MGRFFYFWKKLILRVNLKILLLLLLAKFSGYGQSASSIKSANTINLLISKSVLIPHHDTLNPLKKGYINNYEISYSFGTTGNKNWHLAYKFPLVGLSAKVIDFNQHKVLGEAFSIYPFIVFRFTPDKRLFTFVRIGGGAAYLSKIYNSTKNPTNVAISNSLNFIGDIRLGIEYRLNSKVNINANMNGTHISNGSYKKPNYGLNMIGFGAGINYTISTHELHKSNYNESTITPSAFRLTIMGGSKEVGNAGGAKYYPITLQLAYVKAKNSLIKYGGAVDLIHDKSSKTHIQERNEIYSSPKHDFSLGIVSHVEFPFDRFSSFAELGLYLYKPNPHYPIAYQRIGVYYRLSKIITLISSLRTHLTVAEQIDWGVVLTL